MYLIMRRLKVKPHVVEESVRRIEHGLAPLVSREPGFVEFYLIQVGEDEGMSISIFETQEEGNRKSLEWAKEHIAPLAQGSAELVGSGEVLVHKIRRNQLYRSVSGTMQPEAFAGDGYQKGEHT